MKALITVLAFLGAIGIGLEAQAEETLGEKADVVGNDVKRAAKRNAHRMVERPCGKLTGDSRMKCLAEQIKNRTSETKDAAVDRASEIKNKVD